MKPIRRFGLARRASSSAIRRLMASNTTANCSPCFVNASNSTRSPRTACTNLATVSAVGICMPPPCPSTRDLTCSFTRLAPEEPQKERQHYGDDEARDDGKVEPAALALDADVSRQPPEAELRDPGPGEAGGDQYEAEDDERALHGCGNATAIACHRASSRRPRARTTRRRRA